MASPSSKDTPPSAPETPQDAAGAPSDDAPKPPSDTERIDALYASLHAGNLWPAPGYDTDGRKLPEEKSE